MIAAQVVDWGTIGKVILAALVASLAVSAGFAFSILGAVRSTELRREGRAVEASALALVGLVGAALCVAAIAGGILALTSK
jgi:hypothetical protein